MRRFVLAGVILALCACGDSSTNPTVVQPTVATAPAAPPTIDTTSKDTISTSAAKVRQSLDEARRPLFDEAFGVFADLSHYEAAVLLDGLTGEEVIELALVRIAAQRREALPGLIAEAEAEYSRLLKQEQSIQDNVINDPTKPDTLKARFKPQLEEIEKSKVDTMVRIERLRVELLDLQSAN